MNQNIQQEMEKFLSNLKEGHYSGNIFIEKYKENPRFAIESYKKLDNFGMNAVILMLMS